MCWGRGKEVKVKFWGGEEGNVEGVGEGRFDRLTTLRNHFAN